MAGVRPEDEAALALHRHQCEVRTLLRAARDPKRGRGWVQAYLDAPAVARRRERLRTDLNAQRRLGNTGEREEWLSDDE